jgi:hypothetical protein
MAFITLFEQTLNFIPFVLFEDYMFIFSQDAIQWVSEFRDSLFDE